MEKYPPLTSREKAALDLAEEAYKEIDRKYGENGSNPKGYHNVRHSKDVVAAGLAIIDMAIALGRMQPEDRALVILASSHHDIEQDLGSGENEGASAKAAAERMRQCGEFSEEDIERVSAAIMGTTVVFENGRMRQSAGEDSLSQVIADADLASLGYSPEEFLSRSLGLFMEQNPDNSFQDKFLLVQRDLLIHHVFYTIEAAELFPNQALNLVSTEKSLATF